MSQRSAALMEILVRHELAGLALIQRDGTALLKLGGVEREEFTHLFELGFGSRSSVEEVLTFLEGRLHPQLFRQGLATCALSNEGDWLLGLFFFEKKGNAGAGYLKAKSATKDTWETLQRTAGA